MPKIPEFQKNAKYWISFKELEWLGNFKMNFKKILIFFFKKCQKYQIIQIFQKTKEIGTLWFDTKTQILNFKKIPQNFFQKMPKIPDNSNFSKN